MSATIASVVAGLIAVAIVFIGARFLLAPQTAAAGFGVSFEPAGKPFPWLYTK